MIGHEIEAHTGEDLVRLVRALGRHRYVASRLHLVHVFAVDAAAGTEGDLAEAAAWAKRLLSSGVVDLDSRDERLHRKVTDAELAAVLDVFWTPGERRDAACARLREHLARLTPTMEVESDRAPFDESREDEVFPVLVDAGWELVPVRELEYARHRGAIDCFEDYEVARFEDENAIPPIVTLQELPLLGAVELLAPFDDDGSLRAPFVVWAEGNETYVDYVLRGVLRAAKLDGS